MTDEEYEALRANLRPRLTDEFLATLVELEDITMADPIEVKSFVIECFGIAEKEPPERFRYHSEDDPRRLKLKGQVS